MPSTWAGCLHTILGAVQSQMMKLDESEEAEGLPPACFRRSVAVKNLDVRPLSGQWLAIARPCAGCH